MKRREQDQLQLRLLATTDIHGFYMDYDYYRDKVAARTGLISLATLIDSARSEVPNHLLFDNGDLLQGAPMSDYLREYALEKEHPAYTLMNAMGYDAATIGNHEFNFGVDYLKTVLKQAQFPYVNANICDQDGEPLLPRSVILEREMVTDQGKKILLKIGVTGIVPPQVTTWDKNHLDEYALTNPALESFDAVEAIQREALSLREAGADIVIALAHTGISRRPFESEMENSGYYIAQIPEVDALITGHQHRRFPSESFRFSADLDQSGYESLGIDVANGTILGTPVVMPGSWARWLGVIDLNLTFEQDQWTVTEGRSELRFIEEDWPINGQVNPYYRSLMQDAHEAIRAMMKVPIGVCQTGFYSYLSLIQDDHCIQIVADSQRAMAEQLLASKAKETYFPQYPLLSAVPLFKVGSRKDDPSYFTEIDPGELYFKDVADLYVYPNYLVVLQISGANLKEWLECCASIYHTINPAAETPQQLINWAQYRPYNFDIIKGIEYQIDPSQLPRYAPDLSLLNAGSERIIELRYQGALIEPEDQFYLATNSYRALVDRFPGAGSGQVVCGTMMEIPEVILSYIQATSQRGELRVEPDYNWGLALSALGNAKLLFETANSAKSREIIEQSCRYPIQYVGEDPEKFALYQIDSGS